MKILILLTMLAACGCENPRLPNCLVVNVIGPDGKSCITANVSISRSMDSKPTEVAKTWPYGSCEFHNIPYSPVTIRAEMGDLKDAIKWTPHGGPEFVNHLTLQRSTPDESSK